MPIKSHHEKLEEVKLMKAPEQLRPLFHNYNFESIDLDKHWILVIKTVMVAGTWEQLQWMARYYGRDKLEQVVRDDLNTLQELPRPVSNFWSIVLWGKRLPALAKGERWRSTRKILTREK